MSDVLEVEAGSMAGESAERESERAGSAMKAGEKGVNRVWIEKKKGRVYLGFKSRDGKKRLKRCHAKTARQLKQAVKALALELARHPRTRFELGSEPATVGLLFDEYRKHIISTMREGERAFQSMTLEMFERFIGRDKLAVDVDRGDWARYVKARTTVNTAPDISAFDKDARSALETARPLNLPFLYPASYWQYRQGWRAPQPVGNRAIQREGKALRQVYAYGYNRHVHGERWLSVNPVATFKLPKVKSGACATLSNADYLQLLEVAPKVYPDLYDLLVALHESGHRGSAVCGLLWGDIKLDGEGLIHWREELDKQREPHDTPPSAIMLAMLQARAALAGGTPDPDQPVFPAPTDVEKSIRSEYVRGLLVDAMAAAGLEGPDRFGLHVFRRKLATDLLDQPLKVVAAAGGWKDPRIVLHYQQIAMAAVRAALNSRKGS